MDYDLSRLGHREFEHLTQALAIRLLGPGVRVYGDGPDGGREATFDGPVTFPNPDPHGPWDGYGVIQAKFHYRPRDAAEGAKWLKGQLLDEFNQWLRADSRRGRRPEYFLVVSNVTLSSYPETGGIDEISRFMDEYATRLELEGWHVWDYGQICRLLDGEPGIRAAYYGLIVPGDILMRLQDYVARADKQFGNALRFHVIRELRTGNLVGLNQAGATDRPDLPLDQVAIDLPARAGGRDVDGAAVFVIEHGNGILRPSGHVRGPTHLVILGGPGQGKTTLAQLICQAYRVALLSDLDDHQLTADVRSIVEQYRGTLPGVLGLSLPASWRWPVYLALDEYADAVAHEPDLILLTYIARQVSRRADSPVTAAQLTEWLSEWPWLVVLDGLDEVSDQAVREQVLRHVAEFRDTAGIHDADLLLVTTTRPQGYGDEFDPADFEYIHLLPLEEQHAIQYAERLAAARYPADPDTQDKVVGRVRDAVRQERTKRLMHSPLQVTIVSLLLERRRTAPQHRYELFKSYYEIVFAREVGKETNDAELLERHAAHVNALQDAVGLSLQIRSERQGDAEAAIPEDELQDLAARLLKRQGYGPDTADELAGRLVQLAMRRLVLLVPAQGGGIGFEVRSLQEFMAARALVAGTESQIIMNLAPLVPSEHWRNTWLLAAGRLFADRDHLAGELLTGMHSADASDALSTVVSPAAHLALDLLEDGITETSPIHEIALVRHALELLRKTPDRYLLRMADVLDGVMRRNSQTVTVVETAVEEALASPGPSTLSVLVLCAVWAGGTGPGPGKARQWLRRGLGAFGSPDARYRGALSSLRANYPLTLLREASDPDPESFNPIALAPLLESASLDLRLPPPVLRLVNEVINVVSDAQVSQANRANVVTTKVDRAYLPDLSRLNESLSDEDVTRAITRMAADLGLASWPIASLLRRVLELWKQRQPVSGRLSGPGISDLG